MNPIINKIAVGGASVTSSKKYRPKQLGCQDHHLIFEDEETKFYCFSLADGAGECKYSKLGADLTTRNVTRLLYRNFDIFYSAEPLAVKRKIIHSTRTVLGKKAKELGTNIQAFSCTLMFVAIKKRRLIIGHIGDGMICWKKKKRFQIISFPENGEFLNQTYFITSKYFLHHFRLYKGTMNDVQSFFLMTDGFCNLFYSRSEKTLSLEIRNAIFPLSKMQSSSELKQAIYTLLRKDISHRTSDDSSLVIANIY